MPKRRDNAGAVCDSDMGMGMLFLNNHFLSYRRLKIGVEFRQGSIGTIRSSLATSPIFDQSEAEKLSHTH